jgi:DNA-binding PadR family transcriptional regulator
MKRNLDLVRELLLAIEERDNGSGDWVALDDLCPDENTLYYHLVRMHQAGYIDGVDRNLIGVQSFLAQSLTNAGHDFLDSIRDPEIWRQTKERARAVGGFTVELLGELAKGLLKTQIKKHTGVEF